MVAAPKPNRITLLFAIAAILVAGLALATRVPAPWRVQVHNDEMHHLESWRNRYRTDDAFPRFLERVSARGVLSEGQLDLLERVYRASPVVQRLAIALVDPQPPLFPVMAEVIEAGSRSNLAALRIPSALASLLAVFFMYRLGRALRDPTLGLWLAALLAIGLLAQIYAGIGRPYAIAQLAFVLALFAFVRAQQEPGRSPAPFLLAALFAQSAQWMAWAVVGPLVVVDLARRLVSGTSPGRLLRQTWWYVALSALLLPILAVQFLNPTLAEMNARLEPLGLWYNVCLTSPFAEIDHLLGIGPQSPHVPDFELPVLSAAGIAFLMLALCGLGAVYADRGWSRERLEADAVGREPALAILPVKIGLLLTLVGAIVAMFGIAMRLRFMMTWSVIALVFAGVGAHWLCRSRAISQTVLVIVVGAFAVIYVAGREDPYERILWSETDYAAVAARVREEVGPGDIWCAYPAFKADCLYRYAELPEPVPTRSWEAFVRALDDVRRPGGAVIVFARNTTIDGSEMLKRAPERWRFANEYSVVKFPAREKGARTLAP